MKLLMLHETIDAMAKKWGEVTPVRITSNLATTITSHVSPPRVVVFSLLVLQPLGPLLMIQIHKRPYNFLLPRPSLLSKIPSRTLKARIIDITQLNSKALSLSCKMVSYRLPNQRI